MIITVFTRHSSDCAHKGDRDYKRCNCRKWLYLEGSRKPVSAKTRSWAAAQEKAEKLRKQREDEQSGNQPEPDSDQPQTVDEAATLFLENKATEGHSKTWNRVLKRDLTDFAAWCRRKPVTLAGIKALTVEEYRKTWPGGASTRSQRQNRLSHFLKYCVDHGWMQQNFAAKMSKIKVPDSVTMPLTSEEFSRAIDAAQYYNPNAGDAAWRRQRAIAMLQLLRWSGLRISDAAKLERSKLVDGKLFLHTQKTGQHVYVPLPPSVVKMLNDLPNLENPRYFFWNGTSDAGTPGKAWWKTLKRIFRAAGLPNAHPHTLRDTFAVEMLIAKLTLEEVSILLGHSNTKVTEKHYTPWVRARQEQLERSVAKAWAAEEALSSTSPALSVQ